MKNELFSSLKLGPKNGNTLWGTTFFRVVRAGNRLKIWTVHIHTRHHAPAFIRSGPGERSCGLFLVFARYVSDQATRTSNFSPPAASHYSAARRLEEMSSVSLSSCGRVIGEPWKSKILMKGLPYTYKIWPRKMSVVDCWIKNHAQIQFLVKKSDPPSNFDTGGSINSQNKWSSNGKKVISTQCVCP